MTVNVTILVIGLLLILSMIGTVGFLYYVLPKKIRGAISSGTATFGKKQKTLERKLEKEMTAMWVNESPLIVEKFEESFAYAQENKMVPQFGGSLLMKMLATFLPLAMQATGKPGVAMAGQVAGTALQTEQGMTIANIAIQFLSRLFSGGGKKTTQGSKEVSKKDQQRPDQAPLF